MKNLKPNQFLLGAILITERPILFQTEMVKANLEGRKNQTRRQNGLNEININPDDWNLIFVGDVAVNGNPKRFGSFFQNISDLKRVAFKPSPYGKPGDLLWVRETWARIEGRYFFKSDGAEDEIIQEYSLEKINWKPSIHMPKSASRIWLMVEDIRVERVQDISEDDAKAEGVAQWTETRLKSQPTRYKVYTNSDPEALYSSTAKHSFETLWISINGESSWNSNPWVWVIKYRILSKTGRPSDDIVLQNYLEVTNLKSTL